uniref:Uncharacterized protein n=1 Tax=Parascaris univalens TaxID=6257 RepID=A0A915CGF3_PARUN
MKGGGLGSVRRAGEVAGALCERDEEVIGGGRGGLLVRILSMVSSLTVAWLRAKIGEVAGVSSLAEKCMRENELSTVGLACEKDGRSGCGGLLEMHGSKWIEKRMAYLVEACHTGLVYALKELIVRLCRPVLPVFLYYPRRRGVQRFLCSSTYQQEANRCMKLDDVP